MEAGTKQRFKVYYAIRFSHTGFSISRRLHSLSVAIGFRFHRLGLWHIVFLEHFKPF